MPDRNCQNETEACKHFCAINYNQTLPCTALHSTIKLKTAIWHYRLSERDESDSKRVCLREGLHISTYGNAVYRTLRVSS